MRLTDVMQRYNRTRKNEHQIAPPEIELDYPLACFQRDGFLSLSRLPKRTRFIIIDLPGLRNITDELNRIVISRCKDALCLVAYNMGETDEQKRSALLQEVVAQIKTIGGSLARMVFVFNRIDVFRKDDNWQQVQREEVEKRKSEIKEALIENLPEYRDSIDTLVFSRLSSAPALSALRLLNDRVRVEAAERLDEQYRMMIPREIRRDLGGNPEKWERHEVKRVSDAVWNETSYGKEFADALSRHIGANFPGLVLPPVIARFGDEIQDCFGTALRACNAILNSTEENFSAAQKQKNDTNRALESLLQRARNQLISPLDAALDQTKNDPGKIADVIGNTVNT